MNPIVPLVILLTLAFLALLLTYALIRETRLDKQAAARRRARLQRMYQATPQLPQMTPIAQRGHHLGYPDCEATWPHQHA